MKVYRISKTEYAKDLAGTGAKLYGGRWNHLNTPCIYTSESRALAILEYSVNINIDFIPNSLSVCTFEIDEEQIQEIKSKKLPNDWQEIPAPHSTKTIGTDFLHSNIPLIKIPSIIIPDEYNYILNPSLLGKAFELIEIKRIIYDLRIKKA
jgi:RES domain-containing protein